MGSELSGVVACLQELELVCAELESGFMEEARALAPLRQLIRQFFMNPAAEQGKAILQWLIQFKNAGASRALMNQEIRIENCRLSLVSLTAELQEVLEDLGTC